MLDTFLMLNDILILGVNDILMLTTNRPSSPRKCCLSCKSRLSAAELITNVTQIVHTLTNYAILQTLHNDTGKSFSQI